MKVSVGFSTMVVIVSVVLNLVIPFVLAPGLEWAQSTDNYYLTEFFSMMAHHRSTPVVSSVIVALIVFLSLVLADFFMKM